MSIIVHPPSLPFSTRPPAPHGVLSLVLHWKVLGWLPASQDTGLDDTWDHGCLAVCLSSFLLGGHLESMTCFASLYLARASQRCVRWEIRRPSGQRKPLDLCIQFSLLPVALLYPVLGSSPGEEGVQHHESPSTTRGLGPLCDCPPFKAYIVP